MFLQNLYRSTSNASNKRYVLSLAAQYQRQVLKNPVKTLELVLPQLVSDKEFASWIKGQEKIYRSRNAQAEDYVQNLSKLPSVTKWQVRGSRGLLALEAAQALFVLKQTADAFALIDSVGRNNNDHLRVLAAEVLAECYIKNEEYKKAKECVVFAQEYQKKLQNRDFYYEKSDRAFDGDDRALMSRRLSDKTKFLNTNKTNVAKSAALPTLDMSDWPAATPKVERLDIKAQFIICMISDGRHGAYVGTEDHGVYWYKNDGNIVQYKDELGDPNCYAMCIDKKGRLWVGHLNSGVSVFNGEYWQNYDVIDGPIGERIFDIQCCPVDGDIFLATSAGITRYRTETDSWEHFTREDGLLEDQAASLAFQKDGTLLVGTQCHGLAVFNRNRNGEYSHEKNITAPERFGPGNCSPVPLEPFGTEMPTNQINQILVAKNETVWIATPTGLVKANKNLTQFSFVRGKDYADKVRGLYGGAPKGWKACSQEIMEQLLPEDYVTCLSEDANGTIWIGTRRAGFMAIDPVTGKRGTGDRASMGMADNYVSSILPMPDAMPLIGLYIGGVIRPKMKLTLKNKGENDIETKKNSGRSENIVSVAQSDFPKLPSPIAPPTVEELKAMQTKLEKLKKPLPKVFATYFGEDWKTQGDWLGRTTKNWAIMCAAVSPLDRTVSMSNEYYRAQPFIGPNATADDTVRRWCHWIKTDNPNSLWDPLNGYRRQAEWDDHGEAYPMSKDGPDLWYLLEIEHEGAFQVGMYFFNKDGHVGHNRHRDYMIEVYESPREWTVTDFFVDWKKHSREAEKIVRATPPLARTRVRDFWGGTYKQFLVTGPANYYVKIDRNYSFNTILSAVIVKRLLGEPTSEEILNVPYVSPYLPDDNPYKKPPALPRHFETEIGWRLCDFWSRLDTAYSLQNGMAAQRKNRVAAYRMAQHLAHENKEVAQTAHVFEWQLNQWNERQRHEWRAAMDLAFKTFYDSNESLRKSIESQKQGPPKIFLERHK